MIDIELWDKLDSRAHKLKDGIHAWRGMLAAFVNNRVNAIISDEGDLLWLSSEGDVMVGHINVGHLYIDQLVRVKKAKAWLKEHYFKKGFNGKIIGELRR